MRGSLTKADFINQYGVGDEYKTADGFTVGGRVYLAVPCYCGDEICGGWQMVNKEDFEFDQKLQAEMN